MNRDQKLLMTRIVWGGLCAGPLIFAAVAVVGLVPEGGEAPDPTFVRAMLGVALALGCGALVLSRVLPSRLVSATSGEAFKVHHTRVLIGSALCEGAAMLCTFVFVVTHDRHALLLGLIPYAGLFLQLPAMDQVEAIERAAQDAPSLP